VVVRGTTVVVVVAGAVVVVDGGGEPALEPEHAVASVASARAAITRLLRSLR
jgi:hypothetical protein